MTIKTIDEAESLERAQKSIIKAMKNQQSFIFVTYEEGDIDDMDARYMNISVHAHQVDGKAMEIIFQELDKFEDGKPLQAYLAKTLLKRLAEKRKK